MDLARGDYIWISSTVPGSASLIGAKVLDVDKGRIYVRDDSGKEMWLRCSVCLSRMHPTSVQGVENMVDMGDMHEAAALRNLAIRFSEKLIYTYAGSILIAINPYTKLPLYSADAFRLYQGRRIGELPPHVFAIAQAAMSEIVRGERNCCVIISGESGSGKTETAKLVLQYFAVASIKSKEHLNIEERILEANPVLEAFGNAKTLRNDNSSRFGRFTDISFGNEMIMESATTEPYLLEKSRVVSQALHERNYHIFYCMLSGLTEEELTALDLDSDPRNYRYLSQDKDVAICSRDDASDFQEVCFAMKVLFFSDVEIWSIFSLLSAILHLGNIRYSVATVNNHDVTEIRNAAAVIKAAKLLQVDQMRLVNALTTRTINTKDEHVVTSMSAEQSLDARDALAKAIYGRVFTAIVDRINLSTKKHKQNTEKQPSIGILDIYGFEQFQRNSFEQLCINYASETLQQFYIRHVFKFEEEEYAAENIDWTPVNYSDNHAVLDLIAYRSFNILSILDEESVLPNGSDNGFLMKTHQGLARHPHYIKPKSDLSSTFTIVHYTGPVMYHTQGFVEKNRENLNKDLVDLMLTSKLPLLCSLFDRELKEERSRQLRVTAGGQFKKSLDTLMYQLDQRQPFFIRCIKPNENKEPLMFDRNLCFEQLVCLGILDTIHIRMIGYPVRFTFNSFVQRYMVLLPNVDFIHLRSDYWTCEKICRHQFGQRGEYQIGSSRVFLKDKAALTLEQRRDALLHIKATTIQKVIRGWSMRQRYLLLRQATIVIQKNWRCFIERYKYKKMILGFARLQAVVRSKRLQCEFLLLRQFIIGFQACCRGMLLRRRLTRSLASGRRRMYQSSSSADAMFCEAESSAENSVDSKMIDEFFDFLLTDMEPLRQQPTKDDNMKSQLEEDDLSMYKFSKFAAAYFVGNANIYHTRKVLRSPLLHHDREADRMASLRIWTTILRFMGDSPGARKVGGSFICPSIVKHICAKLSRCKAYEQSRVGKQICQLPVNGKLDEGTTSSNKSPNMLSGNRLDNSTVEYENMFKTITSSPLDQLHFIVGHGILHPQLRDEIFCQICKQLNQNSNEKTQQRGWMLLSLCLGCFPPSKQLLNYLRCFIRQEAPRDYSILCEQRLNRTIENGDRNQPPSYYELQATKQKKALLLPVTLMDGTTKSVIGDSAITASEMCESLSKAIGLKDTFGFSLYIALADNVSSLGSGGEHILDAISQCEQYAKEKGAKDHKVEWRLFFRKEIFAPWHCPAADSVGTDLIYHQVTRGLKFGEYRCSKNEDLAMLIAMQYCVDIGRDLEPDKLVSVIQNYLPDYILEGIEDIQAAKDTWVQMVLHAGQKHLAADIHCGISKVKEAVVTQARLKWPLLFSKFYEAYKLAGPKVPKNEVIVAINWTGIYVVNNQEQVLVELTYIEIADVRWSPPDLGNRAMPVVKLETINGDEYSFQSPNAKEIVKLLSDFLDGLRRRSRFLISLVDTPAAEKGKLEMKKGDLIRLDENLMAEVLTTEGTAKAENVATGEFGLIESDDVYALPALNKPPQEILEQIVPSKEVKSENKEIVPYEPILHPYTLEQFAKQHFRSPMVTIITSTIPRRRCREELWCHSYEPITKPLLKKVVQMDELCQSIVFTYRAIMKYMGDLNDKRHCSDIQLVETIFTPCLKQAVLRDEVYCQIMKQLTNNPNRMSFEKGWELLWLCSGLFPPSQTLHPEVVAFLRSRFHPVAADCFNRMQKAKRFVPLMGKVMDALPIYRVGSRKSTPHQVEIEAVRRKTTQVFHKIYFPNDTFENVEVESCTKAKDLLQKIGRSLGLKNVTGFSLFANVNDKVLSIEMEDFFFDFMHSIDNMTRKHKSGSNEKALEYQIYMMKKLWVDIVPGKDRQADLIFHYPQEMPKYLRGYHKCSKDEACQLAALIYRACHGDNQSHISSTITINEIIPQDILKMCTASDWKRQIMLLYNKGSFLSRDEAKVQFLKVISKWPTFGSTFAYIKQSSITSWPERLLMAINKNGILIINSDTKDILESYPFTEISNWSSGNTYFHLAIGSAVTGKRLLCETNMGCKMDDLLTSYISYYLAKCN